MGTNIAILGNMLAVFRACLLAILFNGSSAVAYDLNTQAIQHKFTPLSPYVFQEVTANVRTAGFEDLLVKAQKRLGLSNMADLRNYLGTCELPEHFGGKLLAEKVVIILPRLDPSLPTTWMNLVAQYNNHRASSGGEMLGEQHPVHFAGNHFYQTFPGYNLMVVRMPRVCLDPNQPLRLSALNLVHELTHLVYIEPPTKDSYFQFNGFTDYLDYVLTGPGGELVAHQNEFLAVSTLAKRSGSNYADLWRQLYRLVGLATPKSVTVSDPYPVPDRAELLLALIKNYSDLEKNKFVDGLVKEVSLHVTKINKVGEIATALSERVWSPNQIREYTNYVSAIKKHRDELIAELQEVKIRYKDYIKFRP